ncbi:MAG: ATP-binding protein [Archangium sp.]|nr:ATP-binding protein [Archangium sp.]
MISKQKSAGEPLRREAEEIARKRSLPESMAMTPKEAQELVHELQVHQIELEMQNEELRAAQLGLDASRARYFDLYDLAPVGYCTLDEAGLILEANLTAATLLGLERGELVKRPLSRFILKGDQDLLFLCRGRLKRTDQPQSCELRLVRADGTAFWASVAASVAHDLQGSAVHRVMLSDISARKLLDQTLEETNLKLERAKAVADKASLAKSEFLSSMSHELRSPLNAILGFAQLMEMGSPRPDAGQQESIGQILKAGWYLLELVNEILDLSAVESGKVTLCLEPTSIGEVLADCQAMIEPQVVKSGIRVVYPRFSTPAFVAADRTRLKQVLVNLLSNGIKYNRPGGSVTVSVEPFGADRLRINVTDTGEGLSQDKVAQLFQSFNRLGRESGTEEGTGIGLMVSKRLVELMGGAIGARSVVGEGSVFWFELSVAAPPAPGSALRAGEKAPVTPAGVALRTVLYVEDNVANMQLVERLVARRPDIQLIGAPDGASAIALARAHRPTLVLMDINLPGISGFQVLAALQRDPLTSDIPVLALSANAMPSDISRGMEAGFLGYLTKPIRIDEFMKALDLALETAEARRSR